MCRGCLAVALTGSPRRLSPGIVHRVVVEPEHHWSSLHGVADREPLIYIDPAGAAQALACTDEEWRTWTGSLSDLGRFHDLVVRSW